MFDKSAALLKEHKDDMDTIFRLMYYIFRDALIYKATKDTQHLIHTTQLARLDKLCEQFDTRQLMKACDALEYARGRIIANGDIQYITEELFYKIKEK